MRITLSLLCFSIIFSAAPAADPPPSSALDTYVSARDRAAASVCAIKDVKAQDQAQERALPELDQLLDAVVPAWSGPGFPPKGTYTVQALCKGDVEFGQLDGRHYRSGAASVTVTSMALLKRWLADYRRIEPKAALAPSVPAVFRSEAFYPLAIASEAAANLHGLVLVKAPAGADLAIAHLAAFAQDFVFDRGPGSLVAVVVRGDRVFIAEQTLASPTTPVPLCKKALDATLARAKAEKNTDKSNLLEEKANREYRACFAQHLMEQKGYAAIQKQAQTLVELLR